MYLNDGTFCWACKKGIECKKHAFGKQIGIRKETPRLEGLESKEQRQRMKIKQNAKIKKNKMLECKARE